MLSGAGILPLELNTICTCGGHQWGGQCPRARDRACREAAASLLLMDNDFRREG